MSKEDIEKKKILSGNTFPVVGVGASAGGLEAFKRLIKAIPVDSGMAYIFVQHLHPDHESALPEILQRETAIPVSEITDNVKVVPDNIYIIPSNKLLVATDGVLQLGPRHTNQRNMAIDVFFASLAEVHQAHAIGVVLSGTGTDGTLGLNAIKDHGGLTFVQTPDSAAYDAMPISAITADVADFILVPEKIPEHILLTERKLGDSTLNAAAEQSNDDDIYRQILSVINTRRGADFRYYKQTTIHRRILRRMVIQQLKGLAEYLKYLRENTTEQDKLYQDMLIPVTSFFRDEKTFDLLCKQVFPVLLKEKSATNPLRIWVAGCSTGEEAYSLGICLHEFLGADAVAMKIQIFATDISEIAIAKGRSGIYAKNELAGISEIRQKLFFTKIDGSYQLNKSIRDMCVFAVHNFLTDPPFAKIDLISCRNVLIYMQPYLQKKAFNTFHYALNEKGFLLLGQSETTGKSPDLFTSFGSQNKLYTRKPIPGQQRIHPLRENKSQGYRNPALEIYKPEIKKEDFQKSADDILLSKYTPAGVIVNDHFDIVHFRGSTSEFLEPSPGKASLNVLKMARDGLSFELRNALHKVKAGNESVKKQNIPLRNGKYLVTIEVIPLKDTIEPYFLILFSGIQNEEKKASKKTNISEAAKARDTEKDLRIEMLEKELKQLREDMRSIAEDQEAANEELQSANEELLSGSEELQSLNEELETSKEEIQSTNEELMVMNQEMYERNNQLNLAHHYSEAIIKTLREPLIILNPQFRVINANHAFYEKFRLSETETEKKTIFELENFQWDNAQFRNLFQQIKSDKIAIEHFEITHHFPLIGERTVVLNARKVFNEHNAVHFILLAFEDITEKKILENKSKEHTEELEIRARDLKTILEKIPQVTWTANADGEVIYFNKFFLDYCGLSSDEAVAKGWSAVMLPADIRSFNDKWTESFKTGRDLREEIQLRRQSDKKYRWHICHASAIKDEAGEITTWVGTATDVHERRVFSEELETLVQERTQSLKEMNIELMHSNKNQEQFSYIASHDLQEPLRKIQTFAMLLQQRYAKDISGESKELITKISDSAARMSVLIHDVLNFSRIVLTENAFEQIDLNEALNYVLKDFELLIEEKKAVITREQLDIIDGIPVQINQLFNNLVSNALKFSAKNKTPVIEISSRHLQWNEVKKYPNLNPDLSYCRISFKDNGIGFGQQYAEQVFMIFEQLNSKDMFPGTGIGLALCQKIVRQHHGEIFTESRENEGAAFFVILPLKQTGTNVDDK